jgi:NADPH-dependent curcumin reductase CurA
MLTTKNIHVRVVKRASGVPSPGVSEVTDGRIPRCPPDGVRVRVHYASVDPGMRGWLSAERNYLNVPNGAVMRAEGIGEVIESRLYDNTGGRIADAVFVHLNRNAPAAIDYLYHGRNNGRLCVRP